MDRHLALAFLLVVAGCDATTPPIVSTTTPSDAAIVRESERPALEAAAASGDWRAARRLALERVWIQEKEDAEAVRLWRLWATGEPKAHAGLANLLLSYSCNAADLHEVVQIGSSLDAVLNDEERASLAHTRERAALLLAEGRFEANCYDLSVRE